MTKHDSYAFLTNFATHNFRSVRPHYEACKQSHLTLITSNNRMPYMENCHRQAAFAIPLHERGEFHDIAAAVNFIALGADALKGIGALMQPVMAAHDEDCGARRSDVSAVFQFFGEALREPAQTAFDAAESLERAAKATEDQS